MRPRASTITLRPLRVDPVRAREVADAFTATRSDPQDPIVQAAYQQLSDQADRWFNCLTGNRSPTPVRVAFTGLPCPYDDSKQLTESVRRERVLEVVSTRDDHDRRHPLLDSSVGGAHDRLRAVHDIVSHGRHGYDFSRDGEFSAWLVEDTMYSGLAPWALATELHGHHSVRWTSGEVAPYKAALLDPRVLLRSMRRSLPPPSS